MINDILIWQRALTKDTLSAMKTTNPSDIMEDSGTFQFYLIDVWTLGIQKKDFQI